MLIVLSSGKPPVCYSADGNFYYLFYCISLVLTEICFLPFIHWYRNGFSIPVKDIFDFNQHWPVLSRSGFITVLEPRNSNGVLSAQTREAQTLLHVCNRQTIQPAAPFTELSVFAPGMSIRQRPVTILMTKKCIISYSARSIGYCTKLFQRSSASLTIIVSVIISIFCVRSRHV